MCIHLNTHYRNYHWQGEISKYVPRRGQNDLCMKEGEKKKAPEWKSERRRCGRFNKGGINFTSAPVLTKASSAREPETALVGKVNKHLVGNG